MGIGCNQSSVRSWPYAANQELSSTAERCAGRGCALIRQLANCGPHS